MERTTIDGITLTLASPVDLPLRWVGQEELLRQLLAAWMVIDEKKYGGAADARQA